MRGGVSYISYRYSKANNKYLKSYDTKQGSKLIYLDANTLHGSASFFQQVDSNGKIQKSLTKINILAIVQKDVFSKLILDIIKN